jgi:hypothetical protein
MQTVVNWLTLLLASNMSVPPRYVYRVMPATVYAFCTAEPGGATKFEVGDDD